MIDISRDIMQYKKKKLYEISTEWSKEIKFYLSLYNKELLKNNLEFKFIVTEDHTVIKLERTLLKKIEFGFIAEEFRTGKNKFYFDKKLEKKLLNISENTEFKSMIGENNLIRIYCEEDEVMMNILPEVIF